MAEEVVEDKVSAKQIDNQPNPIKDIFLGICLFVGMNLVLMLVGHVLVGLFDGIYSRFFGGSHYYLSVFNLVSFIAIFFINAAIFIYLIIKRPRMVIGILAGIPVLKMVLFLLFVALWLFIIVAWVAILLLSWLGF